MAKVKLSKDGRSIDFSPSGEALPSSGKRFRQSPEIVGFYGFIYENGLQREAFDIVDEILKRRKAATKKAALPPAASPAKAKTKKIAKPTKK